MKFLQTTTLTAMLILSSCGGGGDSILTQEQQLLLRGKWQGELSLEGGIGCGALYGKPDIDLLAINSEITVEGDEIHAIITVPAIDEDGITFERTDRLSGLATIDGGFETTNVPEVCARCSGSYLDYKNVRRINDPEGCSKLTNYDGKVSGTCSSYVIADVDYSHIALSGPGGCSESWSGQLVKIP